MAGALVIRGVRKADLGSYRCVSRNAGGEISTTLHLVSAASSAKSLQAKNVRAAVEPELKVANLGSAAIFHCKVRSPGGMWDEQGAVVPGTQTFGLIVITVRVCT